MHRGCNAPVVIPPTWVSGIADLGDGVGRGAVSGDNGGLPAELAVLILPSAGGVNCQANEVTPRDHTGTLRKHVAQEPRFALQEITGAGGRVLLLFMGKSHMALCHAVCPNSESTICLVFKLH